VLSRAQEGLQKANLTLDPAWCVEGHKRWREGNAHGRGYRIVAVRRAVSQISQTYAQRPVSSLDRRVNTSRFGLAVEEPLWNRQRGETKFLVQTEFAQAEKVLSELAGEISSNGPTRARGSVKSTDRRKRRGWGETDKTMASPSCANSSSSPKAFLPLPSSWSRLACSSLRKRSLRREPYRSMSSLMYVSRSDTPLTPLASSV
jgi:hypothetical protein